MGFIAYIIISLFLRIFFGCSLFDDIALTDRPPKDGFVNSDELVDSDEPTDFDFIFSDDTYDIPFFLFGRVLNRLLIDDLPHGRLTPFYFQNDFHIYYWNYILIGFIILFILIFCCMSCSIILRFFERTPTIDRILEWSDTLIDVLAYILIFVLMVNYFWHFLDFIILILDPPLWASFHTFDLSYTPPYDSHFTNRDFERLHRRLLYYYRLRINHKEMVEQGHAADAELWPEIWEPF